MYPVIFNLNELNLEDLPEVQQKFQQAVEHLESLQHYVPEEPEPVPEAPDDSVTTEVVPPDHDSLEQEHLEAKLHAANEHISSLQLQLTEKDHKIELLEHRLEDLCRFHHEMTLDVFQHDRVADMLNKELRLNRAKANKLSHELLVACQFLQETQARSEILTKELRASNDIQVKLQRQVTALKKLVVTKVRDTNNMTQALEAAKRMLQEVPTILQNVKDQQLAADAAAALATREAAQAKKSLEEAQAQVAVVQSATPGGADSNGSSRDTDVARLQAEVEHKGQLLKAALRELEDTNTHHQELARALSLKDDSVQHLTRQVQCLEAELQDQRQHLERVQSDRSGTPPLELWPEDTALDNARQDKLGKQVAKLKEELAECKKKLKDMQQAHTRVESQIMGMKTVLSTKNSQCHRLETELRVSESRLRELTSKHNTQVAEAASQLEAATQLTESLQARLDLASRHTTTLERQLLHAKSQVADLQESLGIDGPPQHHGHSLMSYATSTTSSSPTWQNPPSSPAWFAHPLTTASQATVPVFSSTPPQGESLPLAAASKQLPELLAKQQLQGEKYDLPAAAQVQLQLVSSLLGKLGVQVQAAGGGAEAQQHGAPVAAAVGSFPLPLLGSIG